MVIDFYQKSKQEILAVFCELLVVTAEDLCKAILKKHFFRKLKKALIENIEKVDVVFTHITTADEIEITTRGLIPLSRQLDDITSTIGRSFYEKCIEIDYPNKIILLTKNKQKVQYSLTEKMNGLNPFVEFFEEKGSICGFLAGNNYEIYNDGNFFNEPEVISKINNLLKLHNIDGIIWDKKIVKVVYFKTQLKNIYNLNKFTESCIDILKNIISNHKNSCCFNDFNLIEDLIITPNQIIKIEPYDKKHCKRL